MKTAAIDFSRYLSRDEQRKLSDVAQWKWISTVGIHSQKSILHSSHQEWTKIKGNTYKPAHREVMLMLKGRAIYSLEGKCYLRQPGTVILLDRHECRDWKGSPEKNAFSCLWIHLYNQEYLTYYINSCDASGRYVHELPMRIQSGNASRLILEAWDHCRANPLDGLARDLLKSLITSTLLTILGTSDTTSSEDQHERVVESLKDYISDHLNADLSLTTLASLSGYSPFFLHRFFKEKTSKTPVQYVNDLRLARAVELLEKGYKVESVAEAVGFSSLSYFNTFFKRRLGLSPGKWRRWDKKTLVQ